MAQHIFTGSGRPATTPTAVGQHYIDTTNNVHYISVGTSAVSSWKIIAPTYQCFAFFDGGTAQYISKTGSTWQTIAYILFPGTDSGCNLTQFKCLVGETGTGEGNVRLYDITNANQIALIDNVSGLSITTYETTTITNLPTGPAVFAVDLSHDAAGGSVFISDMQLRG